MRTALLLLVLTAACGRIGGNTPHADGPPADGPPADAAGSGSAAVAMQVSPHDVNLEIMVVGLGIVIAAVPAGALRRRRDTLMSAAAAADDASRRT